MSPRSRRGFRPTWITTWAFGAPHDSALVGRRLCTDHMVACASPDYLARYGCPDTPDDLAPHQVISYAHLPDSQHWLFGHNGEMTPETVQGRLTLNNGEAMRDFAISGLGLAMIPRFIAAPEISAGRLQQVLPDFETRALPVFALWPPVAPMAAEAAVPKTVMIDVSRRTPCVRVSLRKYLKAHRTATGLRSKKAGQATRAAV